MSKEAFLVYSTGLIAFSIGSISAFFIDIDPIYTAFGCCFTEYIGVVICNYLEDKEKNKRFRRNSRYFC